MTKSKSTALVEVLLTAAFQYRLDNSRKRSLPVGWRGQVPENIADKIEEEGAGEKVVVDGNGPAKKKAAPRKKPAAKQAASKPPAAPAAAGDEGANAGDPE